ncbi:MAG: tRNA (adenosine(37)-N6)-threonylcarbamoyltransferase complex ATPase subunit type 1 TsaE [Patescibacteria group bacterium]
MKTYRSYSSDETKKFGAKLAKRVLDVGRKKLDAKSSLIFALRGDLGSGKTTFTQGFLKGLGVNVRVNSPTFVLMKRFKLRNKKFKNVYHLDCYRIKRPKELLSLGLKEIFDNSENIVLVEWPERIKGILPRGAQKIVFRHSNKENIRILKISGDF